MHGHKKIVSRLFSKKFLKKLKPTCFQILYDQGYFKQPLKVDIHYDFQPWLLSRISEKVAIHHQSRKISKNLAKELKINVIKRHKQGIEGEAKRKQDIQDEIKRKKEERKRLRAERIA